MRKNVRKVIAFTLVLLQLALVVCVIPVGALAGVNGRKLSYDIMRTRSDITLDGNMDENAWENVPWSSVFQVYAWGDSAHTQVIPEIPGRFKAMWYSDAEGDSAPTKAYLYYFIEIEDPDGAYSGNGSESTWNNDQYEISVDETGTATTTSDNSRNAPRIQLQATETVKNPQGYQWLSHFVRREGTHVYVEGRYTFNTPSNATANKKIGIDFLLQYGVTETLTFGAQLSWNSSSGGVRDMNNLGAGTLKPGYAEDRNYNGKGYSYPVYQATAPITIDGTTSAGEAWENIPWSEGMSFIDKAFETPYIGAFKAMWYKTDSAAYLYFLIDVNDADGTYSFESSTTAWDNDVFQVMVDETNAAYGSVGAGNSDLTRRTGSLQLSNDASGTRKAGNFFEYCVKRTEGDPRVRIEGAYTFCNAGNAVAGRTVGADVFVQYSKVGGAKTFAQASWNSDFNNPSYHAETFGDFVLQEGSVSDRRAVSVYDGNVIVDSADVTGKDSYTLPTYTPAAGQLVGWKDAEGLYKAGASYAVSGNADLNAAKIDIATRAGAEVRLLDPTGLRFLTDIGKEGYDALGDAVLATGTLILPTDLLNDGELTLEALAQKGAVDGKDYLNVVNDGWMNAATAATDGLYTFSGAIVGIKTANYTRKFSAVGYITIAYADGTTATFYGGYLADNARSVRVVAESALADEAANPGTYTEAQLAVLRSYVD